MWSSILHVPIRKYPSQWLLAAWLQLTQQHAELPNKFPFNFSFVFVLENNSYKPFYILSQPLFILCFTTSSTSSLLLMDPRASVCSLITTFGLDIKKHSICIVFIFVNPQCSPTLNLHAWKWKCYLYRSKSIKDSERMRLGCMKGWYIDGWHFNGSVIQLTRHTKICNQFCVALAMSCSTNFEIDCQLLLPDTCRKWLDCIFW